MTINNDEKEDQTSVIDDTNRKEDGRRSRIDTIEQIDHTWNNNK